MTTLVTGATGLLGWHVTALLLARGQPTRALVRPEHSADPGHGLSGLYGSNLEVYTADLEDAAALAAAVRGVRRVLHCAARTGPWGPEQDYQEANVIGLERLVRAALDAGVERFVHVSSITVHGNDVRGEADESAPLVTEPNPYSRSKIAGEQLLGRMIREEGAPVTIVRPGWIYGPRDTHSFGRFAALIERGRMIMIGSGANHLPLIHVRDAAEGVVAASEAPGATRRAYLLVNDQPVTQWEYLSGIARRLNVGPPRIHIPYRLAMAIAALSEKVGRAARMRRPPPMTRYGIQLLGGDNRFVIRRARQELGFVPRVDLGAGLRESVEWYEREVRGSRGLRASREVPA